ncbi:MAG: hypothetical protein LBH28_07455 [Oscillospiraceae bacterium]|jgi:hypothetical protein|nr:hypothetical protein [Oscillospiraceae bacterium]
MNSTDIVPRRVFDAERLFHAYIVGGEIADTLAMAVVCSGQGARPCLSCVHCGKASRRIHPDIAIVEKPEGKREILIDQIRELKRDVIVVPGEADKKAYIIDGADTMNVNAQNAFLRILEEPPSHAVFILKTENPAALLPTVRSRCFNLKNRFATDTAGAEIADIANDFFSAIEQGNTRLVQFMFRLEKLEKNDFASFLEAAGKIAAEKLRNASPGNAKIHGGILANAERVLFKAGEYLDLNVSTGHISGMICASLMK